MPSRRPSINQSINQFNQPISPNSSRLRATMHTAATVLHPNVLLPTLTSLLAFGFTAVLAQRFASRHRPYYFVWSLGLLWYALAAGTEAIGGTLGWSPILYRIWYTTGAIGVAAYLGAGTLYLHRDPPFGSVTVVCVLGGGVPALAT